MQSPRAPEKAIIVLIGESFRSVEGREDYQTPPRASPPTGGFRQIVHRFWPVAGGVPREPVQVPYGEAVKATLTLTPLDARGTEILGELERTAPPPFQWDGRTGGRSYWINAQGG